MMKILITGGTGFVGSRLTARFLEEGYEVTILTRSAAKKRPGGGVSYVEGDPTKEGPWQEAVGFHDVVVNLAGASIFHRWTEAYKNSIRESRIRATKNVVAAIPRAGERPMTLMSASAVGYYGFCGDEELTEESPPGEDFLAGVARDWEKEALQAEGRGARVVLTRFGIVLGEEGGALAQMVPLFKWYLGGSLGSGNQWFSWVHISDLAEAFVFLLKHPDISGPVNVCSPQPVRNRDLAKSLGKVLHRPSFLPAPAFMVRLILGEFGSVILKGQKVLPQRLLSKGFEFQHPHLEEALRRILKNP